MFFSPSLRILKKQDSEAQLKTRAHARTPPPPQHPSSQPSIPASTFNRSVTNLHSIRKMLTHVSIFISLLNKPFEISLGSQQSEAGSTEISQAPPVPHTCTTLHGPINTRSPPFPSGFIRS